MSAQRPVILEALKTLLKSGVPAVSNRVYLPWDLHNDVYPMIQIGIEDSNVDPDAIIGQWEHTINIKIGAVQTGKFDHQAVWDLLSAAVTAISANQTLGGSVRSIEITGCSDSLIVAGDKMLWPHLAVNIVYRTQKGNL